METENLTPQQRTSDWFTQRLGKVTASRVADTMAFYKPTQKQLDAGFEPREKAERKRYREGIVAERLTGQQSDPEPFVTYDMKWGTANEEIAKNVYQLTYGRLIEEAPFVQHKELMAGASPDGYVTDMETGERGLIEIKCLRSANHLYKAIMAKAIPPEYIPQVQMQLWITDYNWCDFMAFDSRVPEGLKIFIQRIERDNEYITNILEPAIKKFLAECDNDFKHFWASVKSKPKLENGVITK